MYNIIGAIIFGVYYGVTLILFFILGYLAASKPETWGINISDLFCKSDKSELDTKEKNNHIDTVA